MSQTRTLTDLLQQISTGLKASSPDVIQLTKLFGHVRSSIPGSLARFRADTTSQAKLIKGQLVLLLKQYFAVAIPKMFGPNKSVEPTWDVQRTAGLLANCTDASEAICKEVIDTGLYIDIWKYLDKYFSPKAKTEIEVGCIIWLICSLKNIFVFVDARNQYREQRALEILCQFRGTPIVSLMYIVEGLLVEVTDDSEVDTIYKSDEVIKFFLSKLRSCVNHPQKKVDIGDITSRIIDQVLPVNAMCINKANLKRLVDNGVLDVYAKLLEVSLPDDEKELVAGCNGLWHISFEYKDLVKKHTNIMNILSTLSKHKSRAVREKANGLLWTLNSEEDHVQSTFLRRETSALQVKEGKITAATLPDEHIMISYQWDHKNQIRAIKKTLEEQLPGYKVWMDEEEMSGDIMDSMANAVENAFVVLVGVSRKYKESPNCRAEGRYAFKLGKKIIPLMMEYPYRGDGWLGLLTATDFFCKFTKEADFQPGFERLLNEIKSKLGITEKQVKPAAAANTKSQPVAAAAAAVKSLDSWTSKEVGQWLKTNKLEQYQESFEDVDGATLLHLKEIYEKAPDFFFGELCQSYGLQSKDKMKFSMLLKKL